LGNLLPEAHAPKVTTNLGVHLTDYVHKDAVIVLGDGAVGHELGNDGCLAVDLVFQERIEVLVVRVVRHDHQEDEAGLGTCCYMGLHSTVVVELNALSKGLEKLVLVRGGPILDQTDVCILDEDIKALFVRHVVELLVYVAGILLVALQAENGEVLKSLGLMDH